MNSHGRSAGLLVLFLFFNACQAHRDAALTPTPSPTAAPATVAIETINLDQWLGRWPGVEGTSLDIERKGDQLIVRVTDLDGPKTYEGGVVSDHIEFKRGTRTESIRPTDGKGTGMKWLPDEKNCLVITVGSEGYCRK